MIIRRLLILIFLSAALLFGQTPAKQSWRTSETLNGVDFTGLTPAQKVTALKAIRERECGCGCSMKVAECRMVDPGCAYSKGLSGVIVASIKAGHTPAEALAEASASKYAHQPEADSRKLGDKVDIPFSNSPATGTAMARLTIVEYSDFQCPFCVQATPQLQAFLKEHPGQVRLVFKEFPLEMHSQAGVAAAAALAAHKQGKFWPMHDAIFAERGHFTREILISIAGTIGLDKKQFEADLSSPAISKAVASDVEEGMRLGVQGTPTIFLNGRRFNGSITAANLNAILKTEPSLLAQSLQ